MKKIKTILAIFLIPLLLNACSSVGEGLGGSRKKGSDEFLIEKKSALVLPPSFGELPKPEKEIKEDLKLSEEIDLSIEEIIGQNSSNSKNKGLSKSAEQSIIEKINKE